MNDGRNITTQVMHAVAASNLRPEVRHMVLTMALLATGKTGVGTSSQATIAKAMGIGDRHVRNLLAELEANTQSPVRIERRRRGRTQGRGRTSDEYRLVLTQPEPQFRLEAPSTGTPVPLGPDVQPERQALSTGTEVTFNRNPSSEDQRRSDQRSDQRSTSAPDGAVVTADMSSPPEPSKTGGEKKRSRKSQRQTDLFEAEKPGSTAHELKLHWVAELKRLRGIEPALVEWSRAMLSFAKLGQALGLEKAKFLVTRGLSDEFRTRIQPWELVQDATNILAKKLNGTRKSHIVQGGNVDEITARARKSGEEMCGS